MIKSRFFTAAAWGSLASALLLASLPAAAQDPDRGRQWGREQRAEQRAERQTQGADNRSEQRAARPAPAPAYVPRPEVRQGNSGGDRPAWGARRDRGGDMAAARAAARAQANPVGNPAAAGASGYVNPRAGSYGANTRRDWAAERQARDAAQQQQRSSGAWAGRGDRTDQSRSADWGDRSSDARRADWQRNGSDEARRADWRNRTDDARRADWQRNRSDDGRRGDWQRERRDDARNYNNGYRDGRRDDNRWDNRGNWRHGQNYRRWDNRGWRNDNRYDWYRYRAANRSLFSLGRYYAPYRGYSYSRISIGFRLGSPFYANRYWINDPWQYRLPAVYGPYRWVRYYDDALLVDIYSGEVVDVINNFFW